MKENSLISRSYYICRVCGLDVYYYYYDPPWTPDNIASDDICPCCGVHFGYEDFTLEGMKEYRKQWLDKGAKWFVPKEKPENWSLEEQMKNIPKEFL